MGDTAELLLEAKAPASVTAPAVAQRPRRPVIRQYELVERVRSYDPDADEDLLNRAYVFAMKAHGAQLRASGDPYFHHPVEVAGILTTGTFAQLRDFPLTTGTQWEVGSKFDFWERRASATLAAMVTMARGLGWFSCTRFRSPATNCSFACG